MTAKFIFPNNLGVRGLSSTPALHGSNFYTITYEVGESGEKHTVQVNCNHTGGIANTENRFQFLNCRQKRVTTCWTLPSTMTSTWMDLGRVKAPLLAPLVMSCSHRSVSSVFPGSRLILIWCFQEDFAKIDDEATDEELDMLDLAFGLTEESRLGCQVWNFVLCLDLINSAQVCMTKALDGVVVKVPEGVNDQRWKWTSLRHSAIV